MIKLGVNVDHVATIRQSRFTSYPDPADMAVLAEMGGADQITVHLREDRRHIQEEDLYNLKKKVHVPINLEMAVSEEIVSIANRFKPDRATIVPEKREELTTEGGLNVVADLNKIKKVIESLKSNQISVSLFIEANDEQIKASLDSGADMVEFHTGKYAELSGEMARDELGRIKNACVFAKELGLRVAAGHGLNYKNTNQFVVDMPALEELNIGHSIVARAFAVGMQKAVEEMKKAVNSEQ